jgi:transcriptional regulator with XRE-family HTH domain
MAKKTAPLLPTYADLLEQFGARLRTARLRRKLSAKQVSERAGMAPMTLRSVERGGAGVTIGAYLAVMQVLGIERDLELLGKADPLGRALQDGRLPARPVRARVSPSSAEPDATQGNRDLLPKGGASGSPPRELDVPIKQARKRPTSAKNAGDWIQQGEFSSADALASLIDPPAVSKPKRR